MDDPSVTPINKKISAANVFNNIPSFLGLKQTAQTITADGSTNTAVDVTSAITLINATSATHAGALADGSDGQVKIVVNISTGGTNNVVITPANFSNTSFTLNAPGESAICLFKNSKWYIIGGNGFTIA